MSVADVLSIIGIFVSLVGGFLTAYFSFALARKRKIVEYEITSIPLLKFNPGEERALIVSVDKSLLTGEKADKGVPTQINSAYGFEIELLNIGNDDIEKPNIEIRLDKSAKIVEYDIQPTTRPGFEVMLHMVKSDQTLKFPKHCQRR